MIELIANILGESIFIKSKSAKAPVLSIIMLIIVVFSSFYLYHKVHSSKQTKEIVLTDANRIVLFTESEGYVHGFDMNVTGRIDGEAELTLAHVDGPYKKIKLKKGAVDVEFRSDWYSDSLFIFYEPIDSKKAELLIEYDFLK